MREAGRFQSMVKIMGKGVIGHCKWQKPKAQHQGN
jgi:hypothetical protein